MNDFDEAARLGGPTAEYPNPEPKRIKVFGILHLVFAGLGLLSLGMMLLLPVLMEFLMKAISSGPGTLDTYSKVNLEVSALSASSTTPAGAVAFVLAAATVVVLFIAGLKLVKRKPEGLVWSNRYCWLMFASILINVVLFLVARMPAIDAHLAPYLAEADGMLIMQLKTLRSTQLVSGVVGPFFSAIYPVIALIMLNKPLVKNYFRARG